MKKRWTSIQAFTVITKLMKNYSFKLKATVWIDTFQAGVMFLGFFLFSS